MFGQFRLARLLAVVAMGALVLSGCGSSDTESGPTSGGTGGSTSGAAPSPGAVDAAAADLLPESVKSKGSVVVAMSANYPPFAYMDPVTKEIVGMDVDLWNALGATLGLKVSFVNATFAALIPSLQDGKYDVGMSFTVTKARQEIVDFVSYVELGESFYVKSDSTKVFDGLASLCGARVALEGGSQEQNLAQTQSKQCVAEGKPPVTVDQFADQSAANLAVASGRADVGFAQTGPVEYLVKQANGGFKVSGSSFLRAPTAVGLPKGNGMAPAVQAALKVLIADGQYAAILKEWNLSEGAITEPVINGATS